jgi:hypothetical protein
LKAKVNSKIAPVERFWISTPARSRGSNRDSRLQKKFQSDQEVDPALRFAIDGGVLRIGCPRAARCTDESSESCFEKTCGSPTADGFARLAVNLQLTAVAGKLF